MLPLHPWQECCFQHLVLSSISCLAVSSFWIIDQRSCKFCDSHKAVGSSSIAIGHCLCYYACCPSPLCCALGLLSQHTNYLECFHFLVVLSALSLCWSTTSYVLSCSVTCCVVHLCQAPPLGSWKINFWETLRSSCCKMFVPQASSWIGVVLIDTTKSLIATKKIVAYVFSGDEVGRCYLSIPDKSAVSSNLG